MTTITTYTPARAKRLILDGKAKEPMHVTGSLDLSNTQITALPDNLTVGGSLDLTDTPITALPTPWWTERGEATRCRCLAICPTDGYALVQSDTDRFSAGCRNNLTRAQALKHWNRSDARARLFTAAIEGAVL